MKSYIEHIIRAVLSEQVSGKEKRQQRRQDRRAPKETEFGVEPGREPLLKPQPRDPYQVVGGGVEKSDPRLSNIRKSDPTLGMEWWEPYVVMSVPPVIRRWKVKPMNQRAKDTAKAHGAVLKGWPAFTIKSVYTRDVGTQYLTGKYSDKYLAIISNPDGVANVPDLEVAPDGKSLRPKEYGTTEGAPITDSESAIKTLNLVFKDNKSESNQYYTTTYASTGEIPEYVYVLSNNVSNRKRVRKFNVWVCNYKQLYELTQQINKKEPVQYQIEPDLTSGQKNITVWKNNIAILSFSDASKWFNSLRMYLSKNPEMKVTPVNSKVLIPELQYLNVDYDPETDEDFSNIEKLKGQTVTITTEEQAVSLGFSNKGFRGTAQYDISPDGQLVLIPIEGTFPGVSRDDDGTIGAFTGKFKNGAPINGVVEWEDGVRWEGEMSSYAYIKPDGTRHFRFSSTNNTKITGPKLTYPRLQQLVGGKSVYVITTSDIDVYVYWKTDNTWYFVDKSKYEQSVNNPGAPGVTANSIDPNNTKTINQLEAILKNI